jgi:hypothetical protein
VDTSRVRDAADVEQVVRAAIASDQPLEIIGHGSKRQIGQPMATNAVLDLSPLNAVVSYEPNELIIAAASMCMAASWHFPTFPGSDLTGMLLVLQALQRSAALRDSLGPWRRQLMREVGRD